jgi:dTDP-4-dehydrorhamnose reductase
MQRAVLVIGETGQVARALARIGRVGSHPVRCLGRSTLDATDPASLIAALATTEPVAVVNAAAYTAVDKAESEPDAAAKLNADLPGQLAHWCADRGLPLVHLSTDYVFDGQADRPYREDDPMAPLGVYGVTKAEGEARVAAAGGPHLVLRTAWVWSEDGHNFAKTMLRLARERPEVRVVADQRGSPTYAGDLAEAMVRLLERGLAEPAAMAWGTYHVTGAGETTWHGFAAAIFAAAEAAGHPAPRLAAITTADYPTPARRPAYSVLDTTRLAALGVRMPDWQKAVRRVVPAMVRA